MCIHGLSTTRTVLCCSFSLPRVTQTQLRNRCIEKPQNGQPRGTGLCWDTQDRQVGSSPSPDDVPHGHKEDVIQLR